MEEEIMFRCVLGKYIHNQIVCEDEIIEARAYAGRQKEWTNRYGYWLIKKNKDFFFWVICDYVEENI